MEDDAAIVVENLVKTYGEGDAAVHALRGVDFQIERGAFVVLLGPSGSGKTTTLNLVGAIEQATSGHLKVDDVEVDDLDRDGLTDYRRERVGFVFQFYNLVPTLTASENVTLVAEITGGDAEQRTAHVLDEVGLATRGNHFPGQLSGGEQQRVAVARALVKNPPVLLCDEPTGALDVDTGREILSLLRQVTRDNRRTVLLVTHNSTIAEMADRVLRLRDGELIGDEHVANPREPHELNW